MGLRSSDIPLEGLELKSAKVTEPELSACLIPLPQIFSTFKRESKPNNETNRPRNS